MDYTREMQHPVFGPIEYYYCGDKWEGLVRVPFFAAYDFPDSRPGWNRERLKEGLFEYFIQDKAGVGPTQAQERAFAHFQENQDVICSAAVAALVPCYQEEYADRDKRTPGPSQADGEVPSPILAGVERLKGLIRLDALYVVEGLGDWGVGGKPETWAKVEDCALLGFAFSCEWDEHGLGVLFHRDTVVRVGGGEAAWEGGGDF